MKSAKISRRSAIIATGAACFANGKQTKSQLTNNFYRADLKNEFSLGFKISENTNIVCDCSAFSLKISSDIKQFVVDFKYSTYRKSFKAKPEVITNFQKVDNEIILTWESGNFTVNFNGKSVIGFKHKVSRSHASPLLKSFETVSLSGVTADKVKCVNFAVKNLTQFFTGKVKNIEHKSYIGPYVGQLDSKSAVIWFRATEEHELSMKVFKDGKLISNQKLTSSKENDLTIKWHVQNLKAKTKYKYLLEGPGVTEENSFTTTSSDNDDKVNILFGSCAAITDNNLYKQIPSINPDAVFFMGDTPYIDSGSLEVHRHSHREFLRIESFTKVLRNTPYLSTWDDHDFGLNNCDGRFPYKKNTIKAFKEYKPQMKYGDGSEGIYTNYRNGDTEVFLLDCRWFSYTKDSLVSGSKQKTLLGEKQWKWLSESLKNSKAVFKILACGIIWDDKMNREKDDWETYSDERKKLFDFIKREKIEGVVLLGGDIHVSRHLQYPESEVGYPLHQFISSPMHNSTIKSLNVKHKSLKWAALQKNTYLTIKTEGTDNKELVASYWNDAGKVIHSVLVSAKELRFK